MEPLYVFVSGQGWLATVRTPRLQYRTVGNGTWEQVNGPSHSYNDLTDAEADLKCYKDKYAHNPSWEFKLVYD